MRNLTPACCFYSCCPIVSTGPYSVEVEVRRYASAKWIHGASWRTRSRNRARAHVGGQDGAGGDHYRMLGLSQSATAQDIKTAFRQRARQCHPDVNKGVGAGDQFKSIRLAYEVLSDDAKRREYDERLGGRVRKKRKPRTRSQRGPSYAQVTYHAPEWTTAANAQGRDGRSASTGRTVDGKDAAPREHDDASREASSECSGLQVLDFKEVAVGLWIMAVAWHAFGAQMALTLVVAAMAFSNQVAVGYRVASGVAFLIGGEKGLIVAASVSLATMLFGKHQGTAAAIVALALWLGGSMMQAMPLPQGAVLVMAYKCIKLQAELELVV